MFDLFDPAVQFGVIIVAIIVAGSWWLGPGGNYRVAR